MHLENRWSPFPFHADLKADVQMVCGVSPVVQTVDQGARNAKVMGSVPRECMN